MSFLSSYAIVARARRTVITHPDDLKDGDRRREQGRRGGFEHDESPWSKDKQQDFKPAESGFI